MPQRSQYLSHVNDCTCSTNGAHFRGGPIRPAASTITATLHFGQQLWILVGAAPVQQAGVAIPTTSICGKRHSRKSVKLTAPHGIWHVLSAWWANWQEYNQKKNCCFCFRFSIIWKVEATSNSPHFLFIWTLPSSCSFWHCVPAWLTLKLCININISCFVSHPDHPGQISCGENDSLNYRSLAPVRQDVRHRTARKQPRGLKGVGREVWLHEKQTKMFWAKVFWKRNTQTFLPQEHALLGGSNVTAWLHMFVRVCCMHVYVQEAALT